MKYDNRELVLYSDTSVYTICGNLLMYFLSVTRAVSVFFFYVYSSKSVCVRVWERQKRAWLREIGTLRLAGIMSQLFTKNLLMRSCVFPCHLLCRSLSVGRNVVAHVCTFLTCIYLFVFSSVCLIVFFFCLCFWLQRWPYANTRWQNGMRRTSLPIGLCPTVIAMATETIAQVDMDRWLEAVPFSRYHVALKF